MTLRTTVIVTTIVAAMLVAAATPTPQVPPGLRDAPAPHGRLRVCAGRYMAFKTLGDVHLPAGLTFRAAGHVVGDLATMNDRDAGFELGTRQSLAVATSDPIVLTAASRCAESGARTVIKNGVWNGFTPLLKASDQLRLKANGVLGWQYRTDDLPAPLPDLLAPGAIFATALTDIGDPVLVVQDPARPAGDVVVRPMTGAEVASLPPPRPDTSDARAVPFDTAFVDRLRGLRRIEQFEAAAGTSGTLAELHPERVDRAATYVWVSIHPARATMEVTFSNGEATEITIVPADGPPIVLDGHGRRIKP